MGIQGRASLMGMDLPPNHPCNEYVRGIEEYVKSASDLTKQLLGFARGGKYEVKPLDINELVKTSVEMFGRTRKQIRIHSRFSDSILTVEADRRQLEQVLLNVYVNAWQAMPEGGELTIETRAVQLDSIFCEPHRAIPGDFVAIAIRDTGIGMTKAVQHRIFDPFFTTKEKTRGTGLGLASAFGIVKNHGGMIAVDSEIGQGTTFTIYLPASEKPVARVAAMTPTIRQGTETILLIDDEAMIIEVAQAMLEKLGYAVISANSGNAAIDVIERFKDNVNLVILDLVMPGLDGSRTYARIRQIAPTMRVLLSSGYALDGQAEALLRKGCRGFIQKPFTIQDLSIKIRDVLDRAE
jgi:two-component system cell cycle sensor histidine kinase/response regulator CckA